MEELASIASNFGYPAAVTAVLLWYISTEMKEMRKVIEQNNIVITKLTEHITQKDGD